MNKKGKVVVRKHKKNRERVKRKVKAAKAAKKSRACFFGNPHWQKHAFDPSPRRDHGLRCWLRCCSRPFSPRASVRARKPSC